MHFSIATIIAAAPFLVGAIPMDRRAAFTLQNGKDAQALNAKFATLNANSACQAGENACVNGQFSQCSNGKFVSFPCAGGLQCVALPLVNSPGTSVTCDTAADAATRIGNTGATGGLTGKRSLNTEIKKRAAFTLANGEAAQALNAKFQALTGSEPCTDGVTQCAGGQLSQCVGGKQILSPCAGGLQCVALPLVNSAGTSVTCDTTADAAARIAATGATGGLAGKRSLIAEAQLQFERRAEFTLANGQAAQALNAKFQALTGSEPCTDGVTQCAGGQLSQCVGGKQILSPCAGGLQCVALPLVNSPGTSVTCDTAADAAQRIANTGATGSVSGQ